MNVSKKSFPLGVTQIRPAIPPRMCPIASCQPREFPTTNHQLITTRRAICIEDEDAIQNVCRNPCYDHPGAELSLTEGTRLREPNWNAEGLIQSTSILNHFLLRQELKRWKASVTINSGPGHHKYDKYVVRWFSQVSCTGYSYPGG